MKNLKLSSLLAMLVCAFVFTSCSDSDNESDDDNVGSAEDLIGTWQAVQEIYWEKTDGVITEGDTEWHENLSYDYRLEFTADGKINEYDPYYNNKLNPDYTCDYTYSGGKLIINDGDYMYKVLVLNSTTLELEDSGYDEAYDCYFYQRTQYRRL